MASEMPNAIERSVASPTIRAFLPARNPMPSLPTKSAADVRASPDVDRQELAGSQRGAAAHVIPCLEVADGDFEAVRNRGECVAAPDPVADLSIRGGDAPRGGLGQGDAASAAARDLQPLSRLQHALRRKVI